MKIQTERLTIVPLTQEHLDTACLYMLNPDNAQMMVYLPAESREEVRRLIEKATLERQKSEPEYLEYAVLLGGEHIGGLTMYFEGHPERGELGWIIRLDCQGMGYAAEAAQGLMDYFRENYGVQRFIAHCDSENAASRRVMEKLGMTLKEIHGGRLNRSSTEERQECLYEIQYEQNPKELINK